MSTDRRMHEEVVDIYMVKYYTAIRRNAFESVLTSFLLDSTTNRTPDAASDSSSHPVLRPGPGGASEARRLPSTHARSASAGQKGG